MGTQLVRVPQWAFFGDSDLELELPDTWAVTVQRMPGHDLPALSNDEIRLALTTPIGTPCLRDLARGKKRAVIIFDDLSRPTPVYRIWPFVVEELHEAGLLDGDILMVVALGTHGAHSREDLCRKLGEEALRRFAVFNHNPFARCTLVGRTSQGTPVEVGDTVLACELRIGIGSVVPHPFIGFGGGPKIILPGVTSLATIRAHHDGLVQRLRREGHQHTLQAGCEGNLAWQDIAEAAELAGLDFKIDCILNSRREVVRLFAGHHAKIWWEAVKVAKQVYATNPATQANVVIANAYGKGNEATIAAFAPNIGVGDEKDLVVIANCPQGQVIHYLSGDLGVDALIDSSGPRELPPGIRRMIVYSPFAEKSAQRFFAGASRLISTWPDVVNQLVAWHPDGVRAVVYPDLTMQYLTQPVPVTS